MLASFAKLHLYSQLNTVSLLTYVNPTPLTTFVVIFETIVVSAPIVPVIGDVPKLPIAPTYALDITASDESVFTDFIAHNLQQYFVTDMMLDQLKIYVMGDGGEVSVFRPGNPIVLSAFVYNAKRMGSVSLTATVKDWECLDSLWTGREFVVLDEGSLSGGVESLSAVELGSVEKFFLLHTPSSSKSNVDERYVHTLEFTSERDVTLSNVYFYDAVDPDAEVDRYRSNTFEFSFFGTLSEFVGRYNSVLARRGLGSRFSVVIDAGTDVSVMKEVSFDRKTLFEALKAAYEAYEVPFWFEGDVIHFGGGSAEVPDVVFEYGMERELLSVSRNNAGELAVTRCTGLGGETNIPYYYPNPTPKGTLGVGGTATGVSVADQLKFARKANTLPAKP